VFGLERLKYKTNYDNKANIGVDIVRV